jgi:hypothetical protein
MKRQKQPILCQACVAEHGEKTARIATNRIRGELTLLHLCDHHYWQRLEEWGLIGKPLTYQPRRKAQRKRR